MSAAEVMSYPSSSSSSPLASPVVARPSTATGSGSSSSGGSSRSRSQSFSCSSGLLQQQQQLLQQQKRRFSSAATMDPNGGGPYVVQNAVALALIEKLHRWCCQLFWLTLVCLAHYCGTQNDQQQNGEEPHSARKGASAEEKRTATFQEVRRSIINAAAGAGNGSQRRLKTVTDLEMQLLRHLTCPQSAVLRTLRPSSHRRRHYLSRPPSPQLFDIYESSEESEADE